MDTLSTLFVYIGCQLQILLYIQQRGILNWLTTDSLLHEAYLYSLQLHFVFSFRQNLCFVFGNISHALKYEIIAMFSVEK